MKKLLKKVEEHRWKTVAGMAGLLGLGYWLGLDQLTELYNWVTQILG